MCIHFLVPGILFCGFIISYSLRPILFFANTDVFTTKMCLDISILAKSIMDGREYNCIMYHMGGPIFILPKCIILHDQTL
jgi:hypothetical protein